MQVTHLYKQQDEAHSPIYHPFTPPRLDAPRPRVCLLDDLRRQRLSRRRFRQKHIHTSLELQQLQPHLQREIRRCRTGHKHRLRRTDAPGAGQPMRDFRRRIPAQPCQIQRPRRYPWAI